MSKPNILIALGSPSKSDTGLLDQLTLDDSVNFHLSIASAHRTPENVKRHAHWLAEETQKLIDNPKLADVNHWDALIAGAGMANALVHAYIEQLYERYPDLPIIGLPINDSKTSGLSSLLSSQETPPGYVAPVVGVNQLGHAADIARKLVTTNYTSVRFVKEVPDDKTLAVLEELGVPYSCDRDSENPIRPTEIPIAIADEAGHLGMFYKLPVVIATTQPPADYLKHIEDAKGTSNVVYTGFNNPKNAALLAGRIVARNNPDVREALREYIAGGAKKYDEYPDVMEITPELIARFTGGQ